MKKVAIVAVALICSVIFSNQANAQKTTGQQKKTSPSSVSDHITVMKESSTSSAKAYVPSEPVVHTNERSLPPEPTKAYPVYKSGRAKTSGNAN